MDIRLDVHAFLVLGDMDTVAMALLDIHGMLLIAREDTDKMEPIVVLGHHLELGHDGHNLTCAEMLLQILVLLERQQVSNRDKLWGHECLDRLLAVSFQSLFGREPI